jgi:alkylation response protein AidB-like acyl-CoA dehydrogenase
MHRLNEEQKALLAQIVTVAETKIAANADATDASGTFPAENIAALGAVGALGLNVPKEYGGWGQDMRFACAALDMVGRHCASTGMIYLMHLCGIACYAAKPENVKAELTAAAQGKHLSTLAWSEKGSRSHFWAPIGEAVKANSGVTLSSEKSWVTSAGIADGYVVSAKVPNASGPTDTVLYYVPKGADNFTVSDVWNSMGMRGNASAPMRLTNTPISDTQNLCEPGQGFGQMMAILPWFALGNASISLGISEAAIASTTHHITGKGFEHLDSRLADLPNLRERLAKMRTATDRARAHLTFVLDAVDAADPMAQLYVLEAKPSASGTAIEVTDLAMQTCGGAAFSRHLTVERNFRDARAASVMAPTSDVLNDFIGKALCGMPLF